MCTQVALQTGPGAEDWEVLRSVNDLRKHWEVRPEDVAMAEGEVLDDEGEFCLCGTDVEQVLKRAGVLFVRDDVWGDYSVPVAS